MKKPYYNRWQRFLLTTDTSSGSYLRLQKAVLYFKRQIHRQTSKSALNRIKIPLN
jgi:hypothetical protein